MLIKTVGPITREKSTVEYSDVNWMVNHDKIGIVTQIKSINQNIMLLLGVQKKSKWFRPQIGGFLDKHLFEPLDDQTSENIRSEINNILEEGLEPRVVIQAVSVIPDPDNQDYFVEIIYDVPTLNHSNNELQFRLARSGA